jgi:hypothetical protein
MKETTLHPRRTLLAAVVMEKVFEVVESSIVWLCESRVVSVGGKRENCGKLTAKDRPLFFLCVCEITREAVAELRLR